MHTLSESKKLLFKISKVMWGFPTARVNSIFVAVTKHKQNGGQEESAAFQRYRLLLCYLRFAGQRQRLVNTSI